MDEAEPRPPQERSAPPAATSATPASGADVQQLADRVYRLLLAEARLARARGDPAWRSRES